MDSNRVSIWSAHGDNCLFPLAHRFFFNFFNETLCTFQSNSSLNAHAFHDFLNHSLAHGGISVFFHALLTFFPVFLLCPCGFFRFSAIFCVLPSCKHIEIICKTVHILFCAYICSEFHANRCKRPLRSSCNCARHIGLCRKACSSRKNKFLRTVKKSFHSVNLFLQKLCFIIIYMIFSVIRICHTCHDSNQSFLYFLQHTNGLSIGKQSFYNSYMTCKFINCSYKPNSVI